MADLPPNNPLPGAPTGAEPLKKSTGKVQPKKETVRINLPPKPTAAPTIKLPTLPPGGPTAQRPAPVQRSTSAPAPAAIKTLDTILIYAAAVAGLIGVGGVVWVFLTLKNVVEGFSS